MTFAIAWPPMPDAGQYHASQEIKFAEMTATGWPIAKRSSYGSLRKRTVFQWAGDLNEVRFTSIARE